MLRGVQMSASDLRTFAAVAVRLAVVAIGACLAPVRKLVRTDPMEDLLNERVWI
jgi:hypothetical protein